CRRSEPSRLEGRRRGDATERGLGGDWPAEWRRPATPVTSAAAGIGCGHRLRDRVCRHGRRDDATMGTAVPSTERADARLVVAGAISDRDGFGIWVSIDGGPAKELVRSTESLVIAGADWGGFNRGGLSADGSLLCLEHSEHGDMLHPGLRVVDPRTGAIVGEQLDAGMALKAACWSPIEGDQRLVIIHELRGD